MRILSLTTLPRPPRTGQRLRVEHATLMGLDSGLEPEESVVLRVRDGHVLARTVHIAFGLDDTVYDLQVIRPVDAEELAGLGATEAPHRQWQHEDVMAVLCRFKRTEVGCEESCAHCALNPDSPAGWLLQQTLHDRG